MSFVDRKPELELGFDARKMLDRANKEKRKFFYRDRQEVEITKDTRYYRKGQRINPAPLVAEELIANGIAKKVK